MRHPDMAGIAAVLEDAEKARGEAVILLALGADGAIAAADPGKHHAGFAGRDVAGLGPGRLDYADRFMAKGKRQFESTLGKIEALAMSNIIAARAQMNVGVANAGGNHL